MKKFYIEEKISGNKNYRISTRTILNDLTYKNSALFINRHLFRSICNPGKYFSVLELPPYVFAYSGNNIFNPWVQCHNDFQTRCFTERKENKLTSLLN